MSQKRALITGITGQDGSYLAELLLSKNYEIHGLVRRSSSFNRGRIDHLYKNAQEGEERGLFLHYGDLTDVVSIVRILNECKPDEIYNLAAQSHVRVSFDVPLYTAHVDALGALNILEAVRALGLDVKIYHASTSELYSGDPKQAPQNEDTPMNPKSPYGIAKLYAFGMSKRYREMYKMFICNGILFNHESERRGESFVTRKITSGVADIISGKKEKIYLGNLDAKRDWGYAPEFVEAMWLMMQQKEPDDYVIATGEVHSVREFVQEAFRLVGIKDWQAYIGIDPRYYRPAEVDMLIGNPKKALKKLDWRPKVKFHELVYIMLKEDLRKVGHEISR